MVDTGAQFGMRSPEMGNCSVVPVWRVECGGQVYRARMPVLLKLYREGDGYVAENEALNLVAGGSSQADAIEDAVDTLGAQIVHYRTVDAGMVTGLAVQLRDAYRRNFQLGR